MGLVMQKIKQAVTFRKILCHVLRYIESAFGFLRVAQLLWY